jgi:hypothetical protein
MGTPCSWTCPLAPLAKHCYDRHCWPSDGRRIRLKVAAMAWEIRKNGRRCYYRSKKVNGRVFRQYIGSGPAAELIAELDARRRKVRELEAEQRRQELACLNAADAPLRRMTKGTGLLLQAALLGTGHHQHDRGEWRRRRDSAHPNQSTHC